MKGRNVPPGQGFSSGTEPDAEEILFQAGEQQIMVSWHPT